MTLSSLGLRIDHCLLFFSFLLHLVPNPDIDSVNLDDYNIHVIASVFKQWLRDLPNPLMTFELYEEFLRVMGEELPSLSHSLGRGKWWPLLVPNF